MLLLVDQALCKLETNNLLPVKTEDAQIAAIPTIQSCKLLDPKEDSITDLDAKVCETIMTLGNLTEIKKKLTQIPNFILDNFYSSLFEVTIEPTFPFQDFVHWIVKNYVKSSSEVLTSDGSRVICTINTKSVTSSLGLPILTPEQFIIQFLELSGLVAIKALTPEELT